MIRSRYTAAITDKQRWWLVGGLAESACIGSYQCVRAHSLQDSYINLANPANYPLVPTGSPTFAINDGLILGEAGIYVSTTITETIDNGLFTALIRVKNRAAANFFMGTIGVGAGVKWYHFYGISQLGTGESSADYVAQGTNDFFQGIVGNNTTMYPVLNSGGFGTSKTLTRTTTSPNVFGINRMYNNNNGAGLTLMAFALYRVGLSQHEIYNIRTAMNAL